MAQESRSIIDHNPNYDKLHPHIHLIWVVSNDYFNSDSYISQKELCEMWKNALDVDYVPVCDIRRVTAKRDKSRKTVDLSYAVAEVCKYTVKSNDYLSYSADVNKKVVKTLVNALSNRRLVNYYGVFADVRKMINDDEDLIHVADQCDGLDGAHSLSTDAGSCTFQCSTEAGISHRGTRDLYR